MVNLTKNILAIHKLTNELLCEVAEIQSTGEEEKLMAAKDELLAVENYLSVVCSVVKHIRAKGESDELHEIKFGK